MVGLSGYVCVLRLGLGGGGESVMSTYILIACVL